MNCETLTNGFLVASLLVMALNGLLLVATRNMALHIGFLSHQTPKTTMKKPSTVRCSFSLPSQVDADLTRVSSLMGVTRSALLAQMLTEPLQMMLGPLESYSAGMDAPEAKKRLRGDSVAEIARLYSEFMQEMQEMQGGSHESH